MFRPFNQKAGDINRSGTFGVVDLPRGKSRETVSEERTPNGKQGKLMVLQNSLFRSKERSQPRILRASWRPPCDIQVHIFGRSDIQCSIHAQGDCILPRGSQARGFQGVRCDELPEEISNGE